MADIFTNVGRQILTGWLAGVGSGPGFTRPIHVAWGTGTTTAAATQTALVTEAAEARASGTASQVTTSVTNDTYRISGTLTNTVGGSTKAITEGGVFDATKAQSGSTPVGNMYIRSDFAAVNVANGDSLILQWSHQFT